MQSFPEGLTTNPMLTRVGHIRTFVGNIATFLSYQMKAVLN